VRLGKAKWFTVIDLRQGFWQLPLRKEDRWITTFKCPQGLFQWKVLPFGLKTAPALFAQAVTMMLGKQYESETRGAELGQVNTYAVAYVDDIIIFSEDVGKHVDHVIDILRRVDEFGFRIATEKCKWFKTSVKYLGHVVTMGKIKMNPEKVNVIKDYPRPQTSAELHSFLSLVGFYARFLANLKDTERPLQEMVRTEDMLWTRARKKAFRDLKEMVTSEEFLAQPDWEKEFFLETDSSKYAVGGVLYQMDDRKKAHKLGAQLLHKGAGAVGHLVLYREMSYVHLRTEIHSEVRLHESVLAV